MVVLGIAGATGYADLPGELDAIQSPWVIGAAGLMYCVEFTADKIPGVDSIWDALHTFVRVPAGALMAFGATGDHGLALETAGGIGRRSHGPQQPRDQDGFARGHQYES